MGVGLSLQTTRKDSEVVLDSDTIRLQTNLSTYCLKTYC